MELLVEISSDVRCIAGQGGPCKFIPESDGARFGEKAAQQAQLRKWQNQDNWGHWDMAAWLHLAGQVAHAHRK